MESNTNTWQTAFLDNPRYVCMLVHDYKDNFYSKYLESSKSIIDTMTIASNPCTACRIDCEEDEYIHLYGVHEGLSNLLEEDKQLYRKLICNHSNVHQGAMLAFGDYCATYIAGTKYMPLAGIPRFVTCPDMFQNAVFVSAPNFKQLYNDSDFYIYSIYTQQDGKLDVIKNHYLCLFEIDDDKVLEYNDSTECYEYKIHPIASITELEQKANSIIQNTAALEGEYILCKPNYENSLATKLYTNEPLYQYNKDCYISATSNSQKTENELNNEKKEEKKTMKNLFGNIKFGKAGSNYSLTYTGTIAFKGKTYVNNMLYDAQDFVIPFDMLFLVPTNVVAVGDIIEQNGVAYHIISVNGASIQGVNLETGTIDTLAVGGIFGMTMYSKIFNPMGNMLSPNGGGNGFGNILMMQALMGEDGGSDKNSMLMAMMLMQGGFAMPQMTMPMMTPTQTGIPATPTEINANVK